MSFYSVLKVWKDTGSFPVAMRLWDTPVPIPNTTVKTQAADDTWLATAWENKWLPDSYSQIKGKGMNWLYLPFAFYFYSCALWVAPKRFFRGVA